MRDLPLDSKPRSASLLRQTAFPRRERDAFLMATIAYALVMHRRSGGEPYSVIAIETLLAILLVWIVPITHRFIRPLKLSMDSRIRGVSEFLWILALLIPTLSRFSIKAAGGPGTAWEMVLLSTIGIAALVLCIANRKPRMLALSVICSGFLTLFTTAISDHSSAIYFALAWLVMCLYWMIANHWERLEVHLAHRVRHTHSLRLGTTGAGLLIASMTTLIVMGREPATRLLDWGFMPTSGGKKWSDPAARAGVGDGDALIAAQEHASSFGPVDSGIFLQSDLPSLFDMFDDTLGEVVLKRRSEKAMALPNQEPIGEEQKFAQSQHGEASFSLAREPKQETRKLRDRNSVAAFHWIGPCGISLAMQRYDQFDGITWHRRIVAPTDSGTASLQPDLQLMEQSIGEKKYFCRAKAMSAKELTGKPRIDAIKFINLQSTRIPAASPMLGLNIQDVDRNDFFEVTVDECWNMPGRSSIPAMTVVNLLTCDWNGDALPHASFAAMHATQAANDSEGSFPVTHGSADNRIRELAALWTDGTGRGWPEIQAIISGLRTEFQFDRSAAIDADDPIGDFLERRRGGDHLFATTAALMLKSLGYQARLVSGFYVAPHRYDRFAGHAEVLSEDVHLWTEVCTSDGMWIPLEPTPGFLEPRFDRSLWNQAIEMFWRMLPWLGGTTLVLFITWFSRRVWGEWLCLGLWWLSRPFQATFRIKLLIRLLDFRCRLAGLNRPAGMSPSRWYQSAAKNGGEPLIDASKRFFAAADRLCFSAQVEVMPNWVRDASQLAHFLTVGRMQRLAQHPLSSDSNRRSITP